MAELEIRDLARDEWEQAAAVLGRGMRDNPIHVAAFGEDPQRRVRLLSLFFRTLFEVRELPVISAHRDGQVVGVCGLAPPGRCQPSPGQGLRMVPPTLRAGPRNAVRVLRWVGAWGKLDPEEAHNHLGPVAVDAHLQHQGIGGAMLAQYAARLDAAAELGYLETDKPENVGFYGRFGFEVTHEAEVIGVPNWFMRRPAR